ncbi:hypothetical protein KIMH_12120 [Bombiscardovia apis]|uniref:Uncharacterized protein n=1 Tax=Bombiscardovia apis TaxID=2932182 RepID=A0ABN6SJG9_9BIFI|nr:hypothetical protein [Bombiscardovia apis]BDR55101.1 hypothetical protein KIMH_12120 [Bombiscardovia apis]
MDNDDSLPHDEEERVHEFGLRKQLPVVLQPAGVGKQTAVVDQQITGRIHQGAVQEGDERGGQDEQYASQVK